MALTAAQADAIIDAATTALTALAAGKKSVTVGGRAYTSHDIPQLTGLIDWAKAQAAELASTSRSGVIAFREPS